MENNFKKEIKTMALFWFLLPLIIVKGAKRLRNISKSWSVPQEMGE